MPRVLRIMHRLSISGPTLHAYYLSEFIDPAYETLIVSGKITADEATPDHILSKITSPVHYLEEMGREINPLRDFKSLAELRKIIREYKPDIVHTHAAKSGALGRLAAWLEKVPVVVHTFHGHVFHSYFGSLKTKFFIQLERSLARISTKIVTISERQYKEIVNDFKICPPEKAITINLGFDLDRFHDPQGIKRQNFRNEFGLDDETIAIATAGRMTAIKNQKLFIECVAKLLRQSNKKIKVFLIGDGELKNDLEAQAVKEGLKTGNHSGAQVVFTSWRKDMDVIFNGIDIFCLTSLNEGTPVTCIEAEAAGKPVISTNVGGVADVMEDGVSGVLVASEDGEAFTNALVKMVEDDEWRIALGKNAASVVSRFNYRRLAADVSNLYNKLLAHKQ